MFRHNRSILYVAILSFLLVVGATLVIASAFYVSSLLAILGLSFVFWGAILLYVLPVKHIPINILNASVQFSINNIERILTEFDLTDKGIYLPPKNLESIESSLIFIPKTTNTSLPTVREKYRKLFPEKKDGVFISPPGLALSLLFEKEIGYSFAKTDIQDLQTVLPKLIVEKLELAQDVEILLEQKLVTIQITDTIFNDICRETNSNLQSHSQVGCLLSSALACILVKSTGKPISIQKETTNQEAKTTSIEFLIIDN